MFLASKSKTNVQKCKLSIGKKGFVKAPVDN